MLAVAQLSNAQLSNREVIAIDGRTLRHSYDKGNAKAASHRVSTWSSQNRMVLGEVKVDKKSNDYLSHILAP